MPVRNREMGRAEGVGKPPRFPAALICLLRGHRYDPAIMRMSPIPMVHCDRCGREF
jgi:hypothetical protein